MSRYRFFGGERLRRLRADKQMKQSELAAILGISTSYLSQIEHDDRPLTPALMERLSACFPLDWQIEEGDGAMRRLAALSEAVADPLFAAPIAPDQLPRIAEQQPALVDRFIQLHNAYRQAGEQLQIVDDAMANDGASGTRLPWEEVRDWFHSAGNYVDILDRAAEMLAHDIGSALPTPPTARIEAHLRGAFGVAIDYTGSPGLRAYDAQRRQLSVDAGQPSATQRFQLAHQLVALALRRDMEAIVEAAGLHTESARQLLMLGLSNYAAGALLMPYDRFREDARLLRHDIDQLRQRYAVSFEQACHRLSTLQRPGARGVPFYFCRVDMAGNITKRHSATRLQFARFGGACPLWVVHEAVAIPDRILVQLAEMPDGVRYVSMAKGLVKPSGSYARLPRRYAVVLGCEIDHAGEFIYADNMDLDAENSATRIGVSCRLCPRIDCDQRAFPPSDRQILVDPDRRAMVPYGIL